MEKQEKQSERPFVFTAAETTLSRGLKLAADDDDDDDDEI